MQVSPSQPPPRRDETAFDAERRMRTSYLHIYMRRFRLVGVAVAVAESQCPALRSSMRQRTDSRQQTGMSKSKIQNSVSSWHVTRDSLVSGRWSIFRFRRRLPAHYFAANTARGQPSGWTPRRHEPLDQTAAINGKHFIDVWPGLRQWGWQWGPWLNAMTMCRAAQKDE